MTPFEVPFHVPMQNNCPAFDAFFGSVTNHVVWGVIGVIILKE